jgi:hypothetical protein
MCKPLTKPNLALFAALILTLAFLLIHDDNISASEICTLWIARSRPAKPKKYLPPVDMTPYLGKELRRDERETS